MFVHGDNLRQKLNGKGKYTNTKSKKFLAEIIPKYTEWKEKNLKLKGPTSAEGLKDEDTIRQRVKLLTDYKDFIDQQKYAEHFDSRSAFHSAVLEEFMYYLFKDLVEEFSSGALIGKAHTIKDIFCLPANFKEMIVKPCLLIEKKDHDFVIGVNINATFVCKGQKQGQADVFQIPAVTIECKTYLDKTMLEGSSTAAEELKLINPNAIYLVVAEWLKLTGSVNLNKFKVDQIFILRKQKNTDREYRFLPDYAKNPIHDDVVIRVFNLIREHLTRDWEHSIQYGLSKGMLK